jgi:hypothetical protein
MALLKIQISIGFYQNASPPELIYRREFWAIFFVKHPPTRNHEVIPEYKYFNRW